MYKNIVLASDSNKIYVTKLKNNVGSQEITAAVKLSNPNAVTENIGVFSDYASIDNNSTIVLVSSSFDRIKIAGHISKLFEGSTVVIVDEFSAYSDEYEEKHIKRANDIKAGFTFNGLNYQIDSESRINITGKALELQLSPATESVNWISNTKDSGGNDIIHTFTRDEFIEFAKQVSSHYESIILNS